jgi:adenylosuccinate lyase
VSEISQGPGFAISPLDGRYAARLDPLREYFSEFALTRARCRVEIEHALRLDELGLFEPLDEGERSRAAACIEAFSAEDYASIKAIERELNHDVKACEVFLRGRLGLRNPNRIHFALTSEDVNNLAYSLCLKGYVEGLQLPLWRRLMAALAGRAAAWRSAPFPTRTHGQSASPSTAGKEIAVFLGRLVRAYEGLAAHRFAGKLNGATGNHAALLAAAPGVDARAYERRLVEGLGLVRNPATTQIEDHDSWAAYFNLVRQANNVILDLDQDAWLYISHGYLVQRTRAGEVGSSTMPHKVNPIHFENSEGNLQLSSSTLVFLSEKLCRSRMQRDLSDSTVARNLGVALGHHHLAVLETLRGLDLVDLDAARCLAELRAAPELLAEPIQTILRLVSTDDPYTTLKALTRGRAVTAEDLAAFIDGLSVPDQIKNQLRSLRPEAYVGDAAGVCDEILARHAAAVGA